jgi:hypothetical protein
MLNQGFVTVPRLDADLLGDEQAMTQTHRGAWLWLFDNAAWKERIDRIGRFTLQLRRGEIACSYRYLARAWNWSHGHVQRWLKLLADRGKITLRSEAGIVVIALNGYSPRESNPESAKPKPAAGARPVDDQPASQRRSAEQEEGKNQTKVRTDRRSAARRTPEQRKQIRDRWIAKLGRFAAARGIAGFWMRVMGDDKADVDRFLEEINGLMHRERWDDSRERRAF